MQNYRTKSRDFKCTNCGHIHVSLDVHHLSYEHLWKEPDEDLLVVCRECHSKIHNHTTEAANAVGKS